MWYVLFITGKSHQGGVGVSSIIHGFGSRHLAEEAIEAVRTTDHTSGAFVETRRLYL